MSKEFLKNAINKLFLEHPNDNDMTYLQHLTRAWTFSAKMFIGFVVLFVHGLIPRFFETTGTNIIKSLMEDIKDNENKENKEDVKKE